MGHVRTKSDNTFGVRAGSTGSLCDYVDESLRERLRDGRLQPGDRLNAVKLARELGVSRTPVQEALNRLERDGLLAIQPRHGAIITDLEPGQARELYIMREMLQGKAARLAARNATDVEIHTLRDMLEDQKRSFDNTPQFVRHNQHFHDAIFQMAHNRYLLQVVKMFHSSLALLRSTNFLPPGRTKSAFAEHVLIVEAIERRDPDAAEEATIKHIRASERVRLKREFGVGE